MVSSLAIAIQAMFIMIIGFGIVLRESNFYLGLSIIIVGVIGSTFTYYLDYLNYYDNFMSKKDAQAHKSVGDKDGNTTNSKSN